MLGPLTRAYYVTLLVGERYRKAIHLLSTTVGMRNSRCGGLGVLNRMPQYEWREGTTFRKTGK
jgi:hypothetical protein